MEAKTKDLWVFVETNEDGTAKNVGIELLTPGKMMAGKQGGARRPVSKSDGRRNGRSICADVKKILEDDSYYLCGYGSGKDYELQRYDF